MLMVKMFWIYIVEERMDLSGTIPKIIYIFSASSSLMICYVKLYRNAPT
jgi:hypothetical protein